MIKFAICTTIRFVRFSILLPLYWRLLEYSTGIFEMIRKIAKARFLTTNIVNRIKRPESTRIYERSR